MTSKSQAYDHPAYLTPYIYSGHTTAGASGVTQKFCAFTAMKLKQVVHAPVLALVTTAAGSQPLLYTETGTGTTVTTATTTLTVLTSASYSAVVDDIADVTMAQGDRFWYTHGTDATCSYTVAIEAVAIPGSNLAA